MKLQTRLASAFARAILARPGAIALALLVLSAGSAWLAQARLHINTNQLDLISQDLRQVKDIKRVIDMVGGAGHIIIALRGSDEANLKAAADELAARLKADTGHVRNVTYKVSTEWVRDRAALFMKTEDLQTLHDRGMAFLKDRMKRASPFFMEIVPTKPVEMQYQDIVDKYTHIGKKSIVDDYYISEDRQMITLIIKPMWSDTELRQTGEFVDAVRKDFAEYSKSNPHGFQLVEDYDGVADPNKQRIEYGFTGSYKSNYDDSVDIQQSLAPVSLWALGGILLVMLLFFGKRVGTVGFVFSGLVLGVCLAFGFAAAAIGELNMITSILGGILMGTGIDFGIFLVYRLREEYAKAGGDAEVAVRETIVNAGPASFIAAAGVAASFFSLLGSGFRGFSQFGLLAGAGVFLIGLAMYVWVPSMFLVIARRMPKLARVVLGQAEAKEQAAAENKRIPFPKALLGITGAIAVVLWIIGPKVVFDYNSRALMVENQPTVKLQDEMSRRMQISSDPAAIYTPSIETAKSLWDAVTPLDHTKYSTVEQVVSMFTFVPPKEQQEANAKILQAWKAELSAIDPSVLPAEYADKWGEAMKYLDAKPYTLEEVPPLYRGLFESLPETKPENRGFLTFVYPQVDLWNGKNVLAFSDQVENITAKNGETYHAAGSSILMATLARIVLSDTKLFVVLTLVLLLAILWIDLKSLRQALVAMLPLVAGTGVMLGSMVLMGMRLNFMNIVVFPIVLGFGVSQGVYLLHRFNEGTSPRAALKSVGTAVACSTLTALVGWAALMAAAHRGLKTMGSLACVGMASILLVTFTIVPAVLQLMHDRRTKKGGGSGTGNALKEQMNGAEPPAAKESSVA